MPCWRSPIFDLRVQLLKWQVSMTWISTDFTDFRAWMSRLSATFGQDLSESKVCRLWKV